MTKKQIFRFIAIATLGLLLSFGVHALPPVKAEQPVQAQDAGLALLQAGKEHYDAGQFSQAVQDLQQAARTYETAGDKLSSAQALSLMSLAQGKLGQWTEAEAAIDTSLSLLESAAVSDSQQLSQVRARVLNARGRLQLGRGNAEAALKTWQDAEAFYKSVADEVGVLGSQVNQAEALQSLGFYRRAEKLLTQVEQNLSRSPDSILKVTGLYNLGNLLRQEGNLDRSRDILLQSLAVARKLNSPQAESQALLGLGNTERALATRAKELNNSQQAEVGWQSALAYYQKAAATATSPIARIQAQLNQLSLAIETNQSSSAFASASQLSEELAQLPASRESVYARVNLAQSLMKLSSVISHQSLVIEEGQRTNDQGQMTKEIARILEGAIQQAQSLADKRAQSYASGTLGQFYEKAGDWSNAKRFTQQALAIAQQLDASDMAYQWHWQMGRLLQNQAERTTKSDRADAEAIAYYTEAFRTLNTLRSELVALNPDVQFSFRESVEPIYRQLVDLLLRSPSVVQQQQSIEPSKDKLIQARAVIEALQLAELDNFFRDACAQPEAVNIDDLDRTAAVIYPIILKDRLEVILKLPGANNLRHHANPGVSEARVDETVKQLRRSLVGRRSTTLTQAKQASKQLYDWLIEPFQADLESAAEREQSQIKTLVFVLDGSLRNIPMAALYDGKRYLVERYATAVTSGLQLLDPKPLPREKMSAVIAGATDAPSFQKEGLAPLDNVEVELEKIGEQVRRSEKLKNREFLLEKIQQEINSGEFNLVHLATHGRFSSNPEQTYLLDWEKRIKVKDLDELLRMSDPSANAIELLILSACETAIGDERAALGLAGIAIRAGARSTLATLWQVNDASTTQFMSEFYQQLNNPQLTKAEALRNAQIAFLNKYSSASYNYPYYWAPFILVGNWL